MFLTKNHEQTIREISQGDYISATADSFLIDRQARELSRHTLRFYRAFLHPFLEYCNANSLISIQEITPDFLRRCFLALGEKHNPGGVHAAYRTLRAFFQWLMKEEVMAPDWKNPMLKVRAPKVVLDPLEPISIPSNVLGRRDLSRTHSSGYNNETYIIGTKGSIHTGRFAGYPGPIHVEVWQQNGTKHPGSATFEMTYLKADYPEFLPRFDIAYRRAHQQFREAIENGTAFAVTQNEVLDAQVFVEGAHRSAQNNGARYRVQRFDDLQAYKIACLANGLLGD